MKTTQSPAQMNFSFSTEGDKLTALTVRKAEAGEGGTPLIAQGGNWTGVAHAEAREGELLLTPAGNEQTWDLPFVSEGYYDAERHLNYPDPETTQGATRLILPIRRLITCAGQELPIEFFKRLHTDRHSWVELNMSRANQLLLVGDPTLGCDLLLTMPGAAAAEYDVELDKLSLTFSGLNGGVISLKAIPSGSLTMPGEAQARPVVRFNPDFTVSDDFSGKTMSGSQAATELFRFGLYWWDHIKAPGDWGQASVEYVTLHDPRSPMLQDMRKRILIELGYISNDRFGHFGLKNAWGIYPDYGAGGLMNVPENNAAWDWRMIHLNGQWALTLATYTMRSGDASVLRARRGRWIATDGEPQHPLAAYAGNDFDVVLAAGDARLDRKPATTIFTLGQTFTASKPFKSLTLRLGNDSGTTPATGSLTLRKLEALDQPFTEAIVMTTTITLPAGKRDEKMQFDLPEEQAAGLYFVEIADARSKRNQYFGPAILWYTDYESDYAAGMATHGPLVGGSNYDRAKALMDYLIKHAGGEKDNLAYYINDPEYNLPDQKSGRPGVSTAGTFWERTAGGHDAQEGLYYNAGLGAMVELAKITGNERDAAYYGDLHQKANAAFRDFYWRSVEENGQTFSRFIGTRDWDGVAHDYGYTYENLEALARGIGTPEQARAVAWWLDRGAWSEDGGKTWQPDIFSIWRIAAPYNTIASDAYPNVTGTLPYRQVVTNGGTRLDITAREFTVRSKYVSFDNMHERTPEVLGRSINPDRLTGGRTFDDAGGRGRWHFGPPNSDRADIEGYREFFPTNGVMIPGITLAYLGAEERAEGLWLRPELPSALESLTLDGFGYGGATLNFEYTAERDGVRARPAEGSTEDATAFIAEGAFNKAGVALQVEPGKLGQASLTLEAREGGGWRAVATNWQSRVGDGQTVYVAARRWLEPGKEYRLRAHDLKDARVAGDFKPALVAERTTATISAVHPEHCVLSVLDEGGKPLAEGRQVKVRADAGERVLLKIKR